MTAKRPHTLSRLLVVDDDARYAQWIGHHLGVLCPESTVTVLNHSGFERWCDTDSGHECDIVLLTASFGAGPEDPQARGLELLRKLRGRTLFPAVISLAEEGNELTAVRALQLGAVDYLPKRLLTPERLGTSVKLALRRIEKRVQRKLANVAHVTVPELEPKEDEEEESPPQPLAEAPATPASKEDARPQTNLPHVISDETLDAAAAASKVTSVTARELIAALTGTPLPAPVTEEPALQGPIAPAGGTMWVRAIDAIGEEPPPALEPYARATQPTPKIITAPVVPQPDAASTYLLPPNQLDAILNSAAAAASALSANGKAPTDTSFTGSIITPSSKRPANARGTALKRGDTPAPPMTAEFIPGYIIKMKIGESEKAIVYLATSISLGTNVALKVSKTLRDDAAGRQFLEREYTAIIAIRDPRVVQIYDYGVHAGFEYLAMEYLLRGDLKTRMQVGLKEADALRYTEQIAAALRVVHDTGMLHRDLKPPNVMLRENDDVALIDFGLARALDGSTPSTRTGVLRGSPYYMSPEQAQGELLDARSDFYSLGIMFYEMLTGRKPYTGATAMEVLQQHVSAPLPPLPHSLARYEPLLRKLSAKNRDERFEKAEEIIAAIAELRARAAEAATAVA